MYVCVFPQPVYKKLLPLYYPRSEEEEKACLPLIPADIGNSEGEPVVPERQIRIAEKPGTLEGTQLQHKSVHVCFPALERPCNVLHFHVGNLFIRGQSYLFKWLIFNFGIRLASCVNSR